MIKAIASKAISLTIWNFLTVVVLVAVCRDNLIPDMNLIWR